MERCYIFVVLILYSFLIYGRQFVFPLGVAMGYDLGYT
jgi:hypothetical protein